MTDNTAIEVAKLQHAAESGEALERLRFSIDLVRLGITSMTLISGGAMIALFSFLGSLDKSHVLIRPAALWWAFSWFAAALVLTMVANLAAFASQNFFYIVAQYQAWNTEASMVGLAAPRDPLPLQKRGMLIMYAGVVAIALALGSFVAGCLSALRGVLV